MKLVFDNIIYSLQKSGGISTYWTELISRFLNNRDSVCEFIEDVDKSKSNIFRKNIYIPTDKVLNKKINLFNRILPIYINSNEKHIFHSSYYRTTRNRMARIVTTIHDFIPEKVYQKTLSASSILKKCAILNTSHFIAISNNTKIDLLNFYPSIPEENISVIYNGVSTDYHYINSNRTSDFNYIVFVGSRAKYKNFEFVVKLVSKFDTIKLYIIGSELNELESKMLSVYLKPERWKLFVNISNLILNKIYNNAIALLYPSSYEGFGIPVIEAMRSGCPVIALNRSSLPEICGNAAILIDNLNYHDFYDAIELAINNRKFYIEKGIENSNRFSWDKTYLETIQLYKTLQL